MIGKDKMKNKEIFSSKYTTVFIVLAILNIIGLGIQMISGISISLFLNIIIIISYLFLAIINKTVNKGIVFLFIGVLLSVKLVLDVRFLKTYYFRVPINFILFGITYYSFNRNILVDYLKKINIFIVTFFIINIIMYLSKKPIFFKNINIEGTLRYQGFLGDANTLAAISLYLLIISLINIKKNNNIIYSILMLILIMLTGSRGNALVGIIILLVNLIRPKTLIKVCCAFVLSLPFLGIIINLFLYNSTIKRLISIGLSVNGRNVLGDVYKYIWETSTISEKIFGINITDRYIINSSNIPELRYHDFTENSLKACIMFFGILGGILFLYIFISYLKKIILMKGNFRELIALAGIILISFNQDIILNMQMFLFMLLALESLTINKKSTNI